MYFKLLNAIVIISSLAICINGQQQDDSNKMWILIDNANLLTCQGAPNQFTLNKEDVAVKDGSGNAVELIEAPGTYFINFDKIKVLKPLINLSGRMASTLQIPLLSSSAIRLDFPYQVIPQKTLLEGSSCDNESGVIYDSSDRREYCRYCNLCDTSSHVEAKLSSKDLGAVYTPNLGSGQEGSFAKVCQQIDGTTYSLKRSLVLPDKKELQKEANDRYKGTIEGGIQDKLKLGTGKLQVFLNMDSGSSPASDSNQWYANNNTCACCVKDTLGNSKCQASFIERIMSKKSSTCLKCNTEYVKSCLQGTQQRVGCYVVEYNFRVTDNRTQYEAFKKELAARKQGKPAQTNLVLGAGVSTNSSNSSTNVNAGASGGVSSNQQGGQQQGNQNNGQQAANASPASGGGAKPCSSCDTAQCKRVMPKNYLSYCNNMEQKTPNGRRYCCNQCRNVCSP